jgi:hypothetical protein
MAGMAQALPSTFGGEQVFIQAPDNPGIPAGSCQAISQIILGLSGNVTLVAGDTGQFNLPVGITLCKDIDFFVGNSNARIDDSTGPGTYGPMRLFYTPDSDGAGPNGGGVYIRVQGTTGSQSVVLTIIGENNSSWVKMGGGDKRLALRLRLFDRAIWSGGLATPTKFATNACSTWFYSDGSSGGTVGRITPADRAAGIDNAVCTDITTDKNDGNAICIQTPANWVNIIVAAFESQDILNPGVSKWDFTNDPGFSAGDNAIPVANILSATAFECLPICKDEDWDYVPLETISQTGGQCEYDYWDGTNYCKTVGPLGPWSGNKLAIKKTSNFASGDYELVVTITGDGTWFNCAASNAVWAYNLGTANDMVCSTNGVPVVQAKYFFTQTGPATGPTCVADSDCDVNMANRVTRIVYDLGALNPYAILRVRFPYIQYTLADVTAGDEVEVTLDLIKKPCGSIFTCTEKIAEYVTSCSVAAGPCDPFTLPYFPPIDDAVWWSGAALSNCSSVGQTCTLNFYESDGDWGTLTQTLGAWGQWSGLWTSISASIVPDAGNAGSIGDATFFVCICCTGGGGPAGSPVGALGMMGTGDQSHGYDVNTW